MEGEVRADRVLVVTRADGHDDSHVSQLRMQSFGRPDYPLEALDEIHQLLAFDGHVDRRS